MNYYFTRSIENFNDERMKHEMNNDISLNCIILDKFAQINWYKIALIQCREENVALMENFKNTTFSDIAQTQKSFILQYVTVYIKSKGSSRL